MLPPALEQNPRLSLWVRFEDDRLVVHTGKVELGQGISTAIAMIAAEEFDVPVSSISVRTGRTTSGPNEFITAGSMSIEMSGAAVRQACAEIRHHLLTIAANRFNVARDTLTVEAGNVTYPGSNMQFSWYELSADLDPDLEATGEISPKPAEAYTVVGTSVPRVDLPSKLTGGPAFIQDLREPGMRHARVVRPPGYACQLQSLDAESVENMPDVERVVINGSFVGVIATKEYAAVRAKSRLETLASWQALPEQALPDEDLHEFLRNAPGPALLVVDGTPDADAVVPPRQAATLQATYCKPYTLHGSIGPSAAAARFDGSRLQVRSHSQGPHVIRMALADVLPLELDQIEVEHMENAGCYGHNGADDAALDAALLALASPGEWILLKWDRTDEHRFEPFSPAMAMDMAANVANGRITYWSADVYSQTHAGRPRPFRSATNLLAAWHIDPPVARAESRPAMGNHVGIHRNADPLYNFAERRIVKHLITDQRVRTSSTRGLGAFANVFAIESFMDELALSAAVDPVTFRKRHLDDVRAIEVIETAARFADEAAKDGTLQRPANGWRQGRGLGFAQYKNRQAYAAVVVFLSVNEETFDIKLDHAVIAADAGLVIDRDGLANQLEGGFIQAASWTLKEQVTFDQFTTTSTDWESYPILRFTEIPTVDIRIIDRPDQPSLGSGEATQGPTPAAIANAIFDATGLRVRQTPLTPDRLRSAALTD